MLLMTYLQHGSPIAHQSKVQPDSRGQNAAWSPKRFQCIQLGSGPSAGLCFDDADDIYDSGGAHHDRNAATARSARPDPTVSNERDQQRTDSAHKLCLQERETSNKIETSQTTRQNKHRETSQTQASSSSRSRTCSCSCSSRDAAHRYCAIDNLVTTIKDTRIQRKREITIGTRQTIFITQATCSSRSCASSCSSCSSRDTVRRY